MRNGLVFLVLGYVLSQFYRAFLAVMSPVLSADIGAGPEDLARASGLWFLAFALMQLPVGWALDRIGPRRTASILLGLCGGGGAALFAAAPGPGAIDLAMVLIGIGCSPVLMSSYFIIAREFPPAVFGTMAGAVLGLGSFGNILGTVPLAWAVDTFGWRGTVAAIAGLTFAVALALARFIHDPDPAPAGATRGSVLDLLRLPALWLILPMMAVGYAPAAAIRGLWVGPYLHDVFGADAVGIGRVSLLMGLAMIAGNFAYGPLDRLLGTRKWGVFAGNLVALAGLAALWLRPDAGVWSAALLLAAIGFFGSSFPAIMAHGRSFLPPHLVGRGVTLINLFGIGGVGIMQVLTGRIHAAVAPVPPTAPYAAIFLFFGVLLALGLALYAFSADRTD